MIIENLLDARFGDVWQAVWAISQDSALIWRVGEGFLKEMTVDLRTQGWAGVNEEKQGRTAYAKALR